MSAGPDIAAPRRPFAVVTGASSGIGLELALLLALDGHDLLLVADRPLEDAAARCATTGVAVETVETDLSDAAGIGALTERIAGRPVDVLVANAGHGLSRAFLERPIEALMHLVDTNVGGTTRLLHAVAGPMRDRGSGRILVTGSTAGLLPGAYHAAYNASKAFVNSLAQALRTELAGSGVTVTVLMPGPVDTQFMARADFLDTPGGQGPKADPAQIAKAGYEALLAGRDHVIPGASNKLMAAALAVVPARTAAALHARMARKPDDPDEEEPPI